MLQETWSSVFVLQVAMVLEHLQIATTIVLVVLDFPPTVLATAELSNT
jgi:hypothetical protein